MLVLYRQNLKMNTQIMTKKKKKRLEHQIIAKIAQKSDKKVNIDIR